jgi:hypothetical protein
MSSQWNPFSTRFVRPGALEYLFCDGQSAADLVEWLRANHWQGQIVGPHGSGKSTLLAALIEPLERAGRRPWRIDLHDGQRVLPPDAMAQAQGAGSDLLIVDGYEQLRAVSRLWFAWQLRRRGWGAILTAHRDVGYPTLYRTNSTIELTERIVARLLSSRDPTIDRQAIARSFVATGGDVRETLFDLYDHFEHAEQLPSRDELDAAPLRSQRQQP